MVNIVFLYDALDLSHPNYHDFYLQSQRGLKGSEFKLVFQRFLLLK